MIRGIRETIMDGQERLIDINICLSTCGGYAWVKKISVEMDTVLVEGDSVGGMWKIKGAYVHMWWYRWCLCWFIIVVCRLRWISVNNLRLMVICLYINWFQLCTWRVIRLWMVPMQLMFLLRASIARWWWTYHPISWLTTSCVMSFVWFTLWMNMGSSVSID